MVKRIWQAFVIRAFLFILFLARIVPLKAMLPFASSLGRLGFRLSKRYREVGLKNLGIAYGDSLSEAEKLKIIERVFRNFAKAAIAEFPYVGSMSADAVRKLVTISPEDEEYLWSMHREGKGILFITGHFGNFELAAKRIAIEGLKLSVVARMDRNAVMADLFNGIRQDGGYQVLGRGNAAKDVIKALKRGEIVAMLPDQKSEDCWVPFFGRLAGTVAGPAIMALRTGAPLIPCFCVRQPDDTHHILALPRIDATSTGDQHADVERIMTDVNAAIEKAVRMYPDQWLWLHDRWRVTPPAEVVEKWAQKHPTD
ncbi:MAG: lysophospholipid acyltransferase family protein [Capsulimonadaceae bacterium]|nr:lysophospholipid acyltransferase family protein [Capsulimonadaceae bacterium]